MDWLLLTLLAIVARATLSIATKILSRDVKVSPITQSFLLTLSAGLISLIISPFVGGISFANIGQFILPASLMIISLTVGNVLFFVGIRKLDVGTAQIAFSSILIWGTLLSVLVLDSVFSSVQIVGIALMSFAVLAVQCRKGRLDLNSNFLAVVASAVMFAVFQVASADLSKFLSAGTYLVLAYLGPSIIIGATYRKKIQKDLTLLKSQLKNTSYKTAYASGVSILYYLFSYLAYRFAPDSGVVVILLTSQVVLSVIFGIFFLKEKENVVRKLLGGILAFIAGIFIKS